VIPVACISRIVSTHRTGLAACRTKASLIDAGSRAIATSTLLIKGIAGAENETPARYSRNRSDAGLSNEEWNGADTGSIRARFAPLAFAISQARSTAALAPAITTCDGALKLTASTTPSVDASRQAAATSSSDKPKI